MEAYYEKWQNHSKRVTIEIRLLENGVFKGFAFAGNSRLKVCKHKSKSKVLKSCKKAIDTHKSGQLKKII